MRDLKIVIPVRAVAHLSVLLLCIGLLSILDIVYATTPNPGHPWTDVGDGNFQVANTQTGVRTFTFPDANATALATAGTVQSGTIPYGNGTLVLATTTAGTNSFVLALSGGIPIWIATTTLANIAGTLGLASGGTNASLSASNGGIVYSGSSAFAILGGTATAGQILRSGSSAAPSWSTATYPTTAGTAGKVLISDGTNFISSTPTYPNTLAVSGKILISDGTNFVASTPTYPASAGTAGNSLQSDGTNWTSAVPEDQMLYYIVGFQAANLTAVTAVASATSYFQYIGAAPKVYASCNVLLNVTTAAATITWAEVAIFKGVPVLNGNASLTRLGFTSVSATFNSTGRKNTAVTLTGAAAGDNLWVAYGSQATTAFQVRGGLADDPQSGAFQTAAVRPSLASSPQATTIAGATIVPGWAVVRCQ